MWETWPISRWGTEELKFRLRFLTSNQISHPYLMPNWKCRQFFFFYYFQGNRVSEKSHTESELFPGLIHAKFFQNLESNSLFYSSMFFAVSVPSERLNLCLILFQWIILSWIILFKHWGVETSYQAFLLCCCCACHVPCILPSPGGCSQWGGMITTLMLIPSAPGKPLDFNVPTAHDL